MERDINAENRKRTRDEGDEKTESSSHKGKKPEFITTTSFNNDEWCNYSCFGENSNAAGSQESVFDFPWLKEGAVFKVDDHLEPNEDIFAPYLYLDNNGEHIDQVPDFISQDSSPLALPSGLIDRNEGNPDEDQSLWSFQVDELEPIECIWNSLIDQQPPDQGCLNKA